MTSTSTSPVRGLFELTGKTALVTGGTQGVGLMIARGLVRAGARVWVCSRRPEACQEARRELSAIGEVVAVQADVATPEGCAELVHGFEAQEPQLDILVNNAGATWGAPLEEFPAAAWTKVLSLNVVSPFLLVQGFLAALERAGTAEDPARVINIGSIHGLHVGPLPTYSYGASKAAIHHLTRILAHELGPRHVTVNAIAPGPFPSRMMDSTLESRGEEFVRETVLGRLGRPEDLEGVAVFLASRAGAWVTGAVVPVDGGTSTTR